MRCPNCTSKVLISPCPWCGGTGEIDINQLTVEQLLFLILESWEGNDAATQILLEKLATVVTEAERSD